MKKRSRRSRSIQKAELQIVKVCHGIGLCPEADAPLIECLLTQLEDRFVVVSNLHFAAVLNDSEAVPSSRSDRTVVILDQVADSFYHSIESNILLDGAGPQ